MALLSQRRDVTANAAKGIRAILRAEAARDFLLNFHHSQITFGKVVIKRDSEIIHESKSLFAIMTQAVQQVFSFRLFFSSALHRLRRFRWRVRSKSLFENPAIAPFKFGYLDFVEFSKPIDTGA